MSFSLAHYFETKCMWKLWSYAMWLNKWFRSLSLSLTSVAGLVLVGVFVLFCVEYLHYARYCCPALGHEVLEYSLSYCFILCCAGALFHFCSGASAMLEVVSIRRQRAIDKIYANTRGYNMNSANRLQK